MSFPVSIRLKQKISSNQKECSNLFSGCCNDNNIEPTNYYQSSQYPSSINKNTSSPSHINIHNKKKLLSNTSNKYLSPSPKKSRKNKVNIKNEQSKLRNQVKSLQLKKQQIDDIQTPVERLRKKNKKNNNVISVISKKKIQAEIRSRVTKNEAVQINKGTNFQINSQNIMKHTLKSPIRVKIAKKAQNKLENEKYTFGENDPFSSFTANQKQRQSTACFNQQFNQFPHDQQTLIKTFSPARMKQQPKFLKVNKPSQNLKNFIQKPTINFSNYLIASSKKPSSPILNQMNKNKTQIKQVKSSWNNMQNTIEYREGFTFRDGSGQNHLTITTDEENSQRVEAFNPFQKITIQQDYTKKQQNKIVSLQAPKTLLDCRNQLGLVKESVISQMSNEKKEVQHQPYYEANPKIIKNKIGFNNVFNPQSESNINVSYNTSYNPSIVFQSQKPTAPRYMLRNLSSATVNSIMQPIRDSQIRHEVQQSVVMLDFFKQPPVYQRQLQ